MHYLGFTDLFNYINKFDYAWSKIIHHINIDVFKTKQIITSNDQIRNWGFVCIHKYSSINLMWSIYNANNEYITIKILVHNIFRKVIMLLINISKELSKALYWFLITDINFQCSQILLWSIYLMQLYDFWVLVKRFFCNLVSR